MKFTTQNECSVLGLEEIVRNQYYEALEKNSATDLLKIAETIEENSLEKTREIESLAVSNALRIAAQQEKTELCAYIVENYAPADSARLEYFKMAENHLQSIFCVNRMIKNNQSSFLLLDKERSEIRKKYRINYPESREHSRTEVLADDLYTAMWDMSQLIASGEIEDISLIDLSFQKEKDGLWIRDVERWLSDGSNRHSRTYTGKTLASFINGLYETKKHEYEFFSDGQLDGKTVSIDVVECIVLCLDLFSCTWKDDLFFIEEECSVFLMYLILLDYIPIDRITEKTELFVRNHLDLKAVSESLLKDSEYKDAGINQYIKQVVKKMIAWSWRKNSHLYRVYINERPSRNTLSTKIQDKETVYIESLLKGYLFESVDESKILAAMYQYFYLELKASSLYFHVLVKASVLESPSIALLCISVIKWFPFKETVEIFMKSTSVAQSYYLLSILYTEDVTEEDKGLLFSLCSAPVKELFTFSDAIYLLNISPYGIHMPFFGHFIKHRSLISKKKVTFPNGSTVHLSNTTFSRGAELIRKYVRNAQRIYIMPITDINPLYHKILCVFRYKKEYESALAVDPYNAQIIAEYIKHIHSVSIALKNDKASLPFIYEMCKKAANAFMLCYYNLSKIYNTSELSLIYGKLLSILLSLNISFKKIKAQKRPASSTGKRSNEYLRMKKALEYIRNLFRVHPYAAQENTEKDTARLHETNSAEDESPVSKSSTEDKREHTHRGLSFSKKYHVFLLYDLWRIYSEKSSGELSPACLSVIEYSIAHISELSVEEYDYLVKIKIVHIKNPIWKNILSGKFTEERAEILGQDSIKDIYSGYTRHLLSKEEVSLLLFDILKNNPEIEEDEIEEIIERMFFNEDGSIICTFSSWIPGLSIAQRRECFEYLFEYLKRSDTDLLAGVKADLRKKGFIV